MRSQNPYWGTPHETVIKVKEFYAKGIYETAPVAGASECLQELYELGYRLVVVTARHTTEYERTKDWLDRLFPRKLYTRYVEFVVGTTHYISFRQIR